MDQSHKPLSRVPSSLCISFQEHPTLFSKTSVICHCPWWYQEAPPLAHILWPQTGVRSLVHLAFAATASSWNSEILHPLLSMLDAGCMPGPSAQDDECQAARPHGTQPGIQGSFSWDPASRQDHVLAPGLIFKITALMQTDRTSFLPLQ